MLLPSNMADPKSMRKHEVFLNLKRDLALVSPSPNFYFLFFLQPSSLFLFILLLCFFPWQVTQAAHRAEEIVIFSYRQMKEEEARCIEAVDTFNVVEKRIQELTTKLNESDRDKKSAETALEGVERQAKSLRKQLRQAED